MDSKSINNFYKNFKNDVTKFKKFPRAFCFDLCLDLIKKAESEKGNKYLNPKTINAIILILYCWNFRASQTKKIEAGSIKILLKNNFHILKNLEKLNIITYSDNNGINVAKVFKSFSEEFGITGASKALSILNPKLFVMWDSSIRRQLTKKRIVHSIESGKPEKNYLNFLKQIQTIISTNNLLAKFSEDEIAKKIDEFHFVKFVQK